jgi:RNA polymerase sigma-70 factor, ECF subfamily
LAPGRQVGRGSIDRDRADIGFARLYEDHVWRVYGFLAYRLGGDRETTEDLTQLTFERALRAWPRFDPQRSSESTWLLAIAGNALIDHYRRGARVFEELDEHLLPRVSGPEERFAGSPQLVAALAELGDREREVLALRYGGDLTGPEIAGLLGLTLANVQQISSRALRRLRELLDGGESVGGSD